MPADMQAIRLRQIITKAQRAIQMGEDRYAIWCALYVPPDLEPTTATPAPLTGISDIGAGSTATPEQIKARTSQTFGTRSESSTGPGGRLGDVDYG